MGSVFLLWWITWEKKLNISFSPEPLYFFLGYRFLNYLSSYPRQTFWACLLWFLGITFREQPNKLKWINAPERTIKMLLGHPLMKCATLCSSVNSASVPDYLTTVNRQMYVYYPFYPDVCGLYMHEHTLSHTHTSKSDAENICVGGSTRSHIFAFQSRQLSASKHAATNHGKHGLLSIKRDNLYIP